MAFDRSLSSFFLECFSRDLLAPAKSRSGSTLGKICTKRLLEEMFPHGKSVCSLLLETRAVDLAKDITNHDLHDQVKVLGEKNAEKKSPCLDVRGMAIRTMYIAAE